jgi:hypothetical protein
MLGLLEGEFNYYFYLSLTRYIRSGQDLYEVLSFR